MALEKRFVRPDPTGALAFESSATTEGRNRVHRESWRLALTASPATRVQIVERKLLSSAGKAVREHLTGTTRTWKQVYPGPLEIADAALAARFAVFGDDADAIRGVLAKPEVRDRLLAAAEVDLVVDDRSILLSDPSCKNLAAGRGPRKASLDPAPQLRASIPVYRSMHAMLGAVRDAIR